MIFAKIAGASQEHLAQMPEILAGIAVGETGPLG